MKYRIGSAFLFATAVLITSESSAIGAIDVWADSNATVTVSNVGLNRWEIGITQDAGGTCLVGIDSTSSADVIQRITFFDNPAVSLDNCLLEIRKDSITPERSILAGVEEIDMINPSGTVLNIGNLRIDGILGDQVNQGNVEASLIGAIDVGGNWYAHVVADNQANSSTRDITLARTDGGLVGARLYNNEGNIESIQVGIVVVPFGPDIPEFWASGSIDEIIVAGTTTAKIGSNTSPGLYPGISDVGEITIGGDFGRATDPLVSMTMNSLGEMTVDGDLRADIDILGPMSTTSVYRVGDSFAAVGAISLPSNGLLGQITFNNNDSSSSWLGDVIIGSTTLSPATYTETAASLGGGAAGIVPFGLHGSSSVPLQNGNISPPLTDDPFMIRHYGPIEVNGSGAPVTVGRRPIGSTGSYVSQTGGFSFTVNTMVDPGEHVLEATPIGGYKYQNGFEYLVEPVTSGADRLFCKDASGDPGVDDYDYVFTIGTMCVTDINGDNETDAADLGILIGNFEETGLSESGDLNGDGVVDAADLGILLSQFDETCGTESLGGSGSAGSLLEEMGFDSIEEYTEWLDGLNSEECIEHLCEMMEMLTAE